jgi:hypothetical protein
MTLLRNEDVESCWRTLNQSWVRASDEAQALMDHLHEAETRHLRGEGPAPQPSAYTLAATLQRMAAQRREVLVTFEQRYRRWRAATAKYEVA